MENQDKIIYHVVVTKTDHGIVCSSSNITYVKYTLEDAKKLANAYQKFIDDNNIEDTTVGVLKYIKHNGECRVTKVDIMNEEPKHMTWAELQALFRKANSEGKTLHGVVVYSQSNWDKEYSLESRSYRVCSNDPAFTSGKISNRISGDSLDGSDIGVRLDIYKWKSEYAYLLEE